MNYFIFLYLPIVMGPVRLKPNRTEPNRTVKPWCIQKYRKSFQQAGSDVNGDPYIPLSDSLLLTADGFSAPSLPASDSRSAVFLSPWISISSQSWPIRSF